MIGLGMHGFVGNSDEITIDTIEEELPRPTDRRIFAIAEAFHRGYSVEDIYQKTKIDHWFLYKLENIYKMRCELYNYNSLNELPDETLLQAKKLGFSDFQVARMVMKLKSNKMQEGLLSVRAHRKAKNILPYIKQIDTLAGEYPAQTNYLYVTYNASEHDIEFVNDNKSVIVLGSGAYRIGSSVEFDWCGVNAINTIRKEGYRSIMINYNPETVSTDYDNCDRLYFDELSFERVMDIVDLEQPMGTVVSTGGQIPNNLAMKLHSQNVPILGTTAEKIDNAEDRQKFSSLLDKIGVDQPRWSELSTIEEIHKFVDDVGFPVLIRPSYVLSGAAMNVVSNSDQLEHFLKLAVKVSKEHPVVVSEFIEQAKEIEIDAVADKGEIVAYAISEHVEFAGVHSGDATIVFPPQKLYIETIRRIKRIAREVAKGLEISGPFNMQLLAKDNDIKVIECNLRASRSFPFVSKVMKLNLIELATQVMLGVPYIKPDKSLFELDHVGIKAPQFSFHRLLNADPVLGVDMSSTGEVACLGDNYYEAILKSMLSVGYNIPKKNVLISSGPTRSKVELLKSAAMLVDKGYNLFATEGTCKFFRDNNIECTRLHWPDEEDRKPNTIDYIKQKKLDLVINIPKDHTRRELSNGYRIRRNAIDYNIPLITNARVASAFIYAFCKYNIEDLAIKSWNEYR
jgi:carbamoyl-phosphate synthase large subunit